MDRQIERGDIVRGPIYSVTYEVLHVEHGKVMARSLDNGAVVLLTETGVRLVDTESTR